MKNEMVLFNGVKIEISENEVNVISTTGETVRFDDAGKMFRKCSVAQENAFDVMGSKEQEIAERLAKKAKSNNKRQDKFINLVKEAAAKVNEAYYIANMEASIDNAGKLYYKKGEVVAHGLSCNEWKQKAREFAPECGSELASKYQLILWYAYRIAMGFWTLSYVCDDSSSMGNYTDSPNAANKFEVSGAREVGGARDGVGNTVKLVDCGDFGYAVAGGFFGCQGKRYPVADFGHVIANSLQCATSGVIVLNKVPPTFD